MQDRAQLNQLKSSFQIKFYHKILRNLETQQYITVLILKKIQQPSRIK